MCLRQHLRFYLLTLANVGDQFLILWGQDARVWFPWWVLTADFSLEEGSSMNLGDWGRGTRQVSRKPSSAFWVGALEAIQHIEGWVSLGTYWLGAHAAEAALLLGPAVGLFYSLLEKTYVFPGQGLFRESKRKSLPHSCAQVRRVNVKQLWLFSKGQLG